MSLQLLLQNESFQVPLHKDGKSANVVTLVTISATSACPSPSGTGVPVSIDLVVAIDRSESMFNCVDEEKTRLQLAQRVVRALHGTLKPDDRLGIVTFGTSAHVRERLSS